MKKGAAAVGALLVAFAVGFAGTALGAANDTTLASRANGPAGASANADAFPGAPALSANGRYLAFSTTADNLVAADADSFEDVYVRDLKTETTTLVSVSSNETKGDSDSLEPSISADGTRVAFASQATNLDPNAPQGGIFVRDLTAGTTTLASVATNGDTADGSLSNPVISGDGSRVAFQAASTNLDAADPGSTDQIYVRDLTASTTTLASRASGGAGAVANSFSTSPAISSDGSRVAFQSAGTNLSADDSSGGYDIYVRDLGSNTTTLVSRADGAAGAKAALPALYASISGDGTRVAFQSQSNNLDPADTDTFPDVFVRDLGADTTTLASRASGAAGAKGNNVSNLAPGAISADGTRVAFASAATDLDPADTDTAFDVYVRDLATHRTILASRVSGPTGARGSTDSLNASIAPGGESVAFSSGAVNLDPADSDANIDVYVRDIAALTPPPDTKITAAKVNSKKGKAKFRFKAVGASTGLQCALAKGHRKPKFDSCGSPKTYRHLDAGRYKFEVRAVGDAGKDPTPAKQKFKI